jgi:hypothetical protein
LLAILMVVAVRRYNTACIPRWRRFMVFINATKHHNWKSTRSDWHQLYMPTPILGVYFIVKSLYKGSSSPTNNRGMTHQSDEKHLHNMSQYFCRGGLYSLLLLYDLITITCH